LAGISTGVIKEKSMKKGQVEKREREKNGVSVNQKEIKDPARKGQRVLRH